MIHYPGKDVKGIPKASIGIVLVGSQQAAVPIMGFWP